MKQDRELAETRPVLEPEIERGTDWLDMVSIDCGGRVPEWSHIADEIFSSHHFETVLGYESTGTRDRNETWRMRTHPDDLEGTERVFEEYVKDLTGTLKLEVRFLHRDGTYRWLLLRGIAFGDEKGTSFKLAVSFFDQTDRRKAEQEVRELHNFLNSIIENIPNMIFVKDAKELRFIRFNRAGENLLGYSREELLGKNDYDFFPRQEAEFFIAKDHDVLARGALLDIPEESIHTRDGVKILHTKKIPIFDLDGKPIYLLGISEDITERKRADEALAKSTEELQRSNRELEQFAYVASHDLQEPLRMVASYTQLLERRYHDKLDEKGLEFIHFAVDGATRMQVLINDLLTFSRAGTRAHPFEKTDLEATLNSALFNLKLAIEESGAEITHDPLPVVVVDPTQWLQLLQNLIGNAIKFRGLAPPRIHLSAVSHKDEWLFSVRDNGIGIEPQYHERIFQIFQRLHTRKKYPGTGIGLALCKRIVERHGGKIWLDSSGGTGTIFNFTLPSKKSGLIKNIRI